MIPIQLASVVFGLFMMYFVRLHYKKNHIERFEFLIWMALWVGFIILAVLPQTFQTIAQSLRISRVFDLLNIIALMILTFLVFHNTVKSKQFEQKLEELIRRKALHEKPEASKHKRRHTKL